MAVRERPMDDEQHPPPLEARAFELSLITRLMVANAIAGAVVTTYLVLAAHLPSGVSRVDNFIRTAVAFVAFLLLLSALAITRAKRVFRPILGWIDEGRAPTTAEREGVLRLPRTVAFFQLPYWVTAALVTATVQAFVATNAKPLFTIVGTLEGGLFASALGYLLAERTLRPLLALALEGTEPGPRPPVGVGPRLLLAWFVGSGIPLLGVVTTPFVANDSDLPVTVPMVFLAGAGFVSGLLLIAAAARSIGEPVREVRRALNRVARGDLTAELLVDNAGEVGHLQRGFNTMVSGLREREQLADLFDRHVGPEVAQRALQEGAELGGEVRTVSALFVDIIGSTALTRERSPAEVVTILNDFFAIVVSCVGAEGGWVNKFEGDGALCVFGAPTEHADHARSALRAARHLALALREIEAGIGVSSGEAVAGNVGAERRLEYTVIGVPVNEAARLSEAAKAKRGRVLASKASVEAAGDEAGAWIDAGVVSLRGIGTEFAVCEPRS